MDVATSPRCHIHTLQKVCCLSQQCEELREAPQDTRRGGGVCKGARTQQEDHYLLLCVSRTRCLKSPADDLRS